MKNNYFLIMLITLFTYNKEVIRAQCITPTITSVNSSSRCGPGTLTLSATASTNSAVFTWYSSPSGGSPIGTGTFVTPNISSSTTYYVSAGVGGSSGSVGPLSPAALGGTGGGTSVGIGTYYMQFDVLAPVTLVSVDIFPTAGIGSSSSIVIQDNMNTAIATVPYVTTVTGGATPQTILLNVNLPVGSGYKMGQGANIALFRNTAGAIYPYTSPAINIVSNNFNPVYYYYFYNWQFSSGCHSPRSAVVAAVNPLPTITMSSFPSAAVCGATSLTLSASGASTYTWTSGPASSSITVSPGATTTYSIQGTDNLGCVGNSALTVTVFPGLPALSVTNTANSGGVCPGETVTLNAGGAVTYTWTGGSPTVTNGVAFTPTTSLNYVVTGENACGTSTAATSVSVHPLPTINTAASSNTVCSGNSMTLTATGNSTNYAWSGGISNGVGFIPTTTNTYVVIGTSALSCTASASIPVTVYTTPDAPPTASPTLICLGNSSTLSAVGAANYTWASMSQTVFTNTFVVTPASMGITTYTITKANSTCSDVQTISVITNPLPSVFAFVTPTIMCSFNTATLSVGGAQSYVWTAPGSPSFTFSGASALVGPPVATTYSVAASDGTCVTTTTVFLDVSTNPTITTSPSSADVCVGETVTITASGANSYTWASASGTLNSSVFTDTPASSTAYTVTGENAAGCKATTNQIIFVNPDPIIVISPTNMIVCSGNPVTFTASGASSYVWDNNAGGVLTNTALVNPTLNSSGFVTYSVQGTSSVNCIGTATVQVGVYIPTLTVSGNTAACQGGPINLLVSGGNPTSYQWTDGTNTSTGQNLSTTALAAVVYTISGTSNSLTLVCPAEQTIGISVSPNPTITAVREHSVFCINHESINLIAGGGDNYTWSNAMTGATINVAPIVNTIYTVTGTDAGTGCSNTATVEVRISPCTGINELAGNTLNLLVYPNPNNGEFTIETSSDMRLTLVNELGQLIRVIELEDANEHKVSIEGLAKGIYFINGQHDGISINQKIVVTR